VNKKNKNIKNEYLLRDLIIRLSGRWECLNSHFTELLNHHVIKRNIYIEREKEGEEGEEEKSDANSRKRNTED